MFSPLTHDQLDRLRAYCQCIHSMGLSVSCPTHPDVFRSLAEACLDARHLHTIYGTRGWYNMDQAMALLGRPSLRRLSLDLTYWSEACGSRMPRILGKLCVAVPTIERFVVRHPG